MEPMQTVDQKLDYERDRKLFTFAWNLATDKDGENVLFDYSKCTGKTLLSSGKMKSGWFRGPNNYFEFFTLAEAKTLRIFLKMVHPAREANESSGESFDIVYAFVDSYRRQRDSSGRKFIRVRDLETCDREIIEKVKFSPSSPPKDYSDVKDKCSKWVVSWMVATLPENTYVPAKEVTGLGFRIRVQRNVWGDKLISMNRMNGRSFDISSDGKMNTRHLLFSSNLADFMVHCGKKKFPAHKVILASKSEVFAAMFSSPMEESRTGRVNIVDSEPEIVEELLRFIYTGEIKNLAKNAALIYQIADKYDVEDLKLMTESFMIGAITNQNVLEVYAMGKMLNSDAMVNNCLEQMKWEKTEIWRTGAEFWRDCQTYPELFGAVFS